MPYSIHCHPDNLAFFRRVAARSVRPNGPLEGMMGGVAVHTSEYLPKTRKVWVPPKSKFWELEETDAVWAIPLGIGKFMVQPFFMGINVPARPGRYPTSADFGLR